MSRIVVGSSSTDKVILALRIPVPGETILGGRFMPAAVSVTRRGARPFLPTREKVED